MSFSIYGNGQVAKITSKDGSVAVVSTNGDGTGEVDLSAIGGGGGSGVSSFNARTGAITLLSADVVSALGFTPASSLGITLGGTTLADFTISPSTPGHQLSFPNTVPAGWNTAAGRMTYECQFTLNSYLLQNPAGHIFISLRQDPALVGTAITGQGVALGNLGSYTQYSPSVLLESFSSGSNHVYQNTYQSAAQPLIDGQLYKLVISSTVSPTGNKYLRYILYIYNAAPYTGSVPIWEMLNDTGEMLDLATTADLTKSGISLGSVFEGTGTTWSIAFTNNKITWGPCYEVLSSPSSKFSVYGGDLFGPLNFAGTKSVIGLKTSNTTDYSTFTALQTTAANLSTGVVAKPNGTATGASFVAVNSSNPAVNYQAAYFGMSGAEAQIVTFGVGTYATTFPALKTYIGVGALMQTVDSNGTTIAGSLTMLNSSGNNGGTFKLYTLAGSDLSNYTTFQTQTANLATSLIAKPNGSATAANFIAVNSSTPSTNYQAAAFGVQSNIASILTYGIGSSSPPELHVQIGIGNTVAKFLSTGLSVNGLPLFLDSSSGFSMKYNASTGYLEFYSGTTRRGYVNITSGADVNFNSGASSGVTSFNSRTGVVSLTSSDVTSALGYTPPGLGSSNTFTSPNTFNSDLQVNGTLYSLYSTVFAANTTASWVSTGNYFTTAGAANGYLRVQISGVNYKIPLYNM